MMRPAGLLARAGWLARPARPSWAARLERVALQSARAERFRRGEISIAVVGDRAMTELHARHCGIRAPTDVLTFDLGTDRSRRVIDGEIVICVGAARRSIGGAASDARLRAELALYVVHGVLHLAGHDDHDARDFARMHAREDELLQRLGFGRVYAKGVPPAALAGQAGATRMRARRKS